MTVPSRPMAFTARAKGRANRLITEVTIFPAHVAGSPQPPGQKYGALYDTGATNSSVSPRVVADLNLPSVGARKVGVGGGNLDTTSHLVNISLPNGVMFQMTLVSKIALQGDIDVLIGMDILGAGDFAVTHQNGCTTFSFCVPSQREIDYTSVAHQSMPVFRAGRNDKCPCGSGNKFKKCHGA